VDGQRVFVKAIGPTPNPDSPAIHRREARIVSALPDGVPAPRLRWVLDEGEAGWVLLAFDEVYGEHPAQPWRIEQLDRVLGGLAELAVALTPSPLSVGAVASASERLATRICGWQHMRTEEAPMVEGLDAWSRRHLQALADLELRAPEAVKGETLLHFDVRADNVLLAPNKVWFFDWPHACVGAAWLDVLAFAPSVTMQGGPPPEEVIARYPACQGVDPGDITSALAAIAGFFIRTSLEPPPPGLPTVRAFQAAQGVIAREWLAQRTGWT
jgi:aminoglycoside phosphotransferase (APT) family kinase protein